eukprot:1145912-Pelagomonas_calceolata.AAC.7
MHEYCSTVLELRVHPSKYSALIESVILFASFKLLSQFQAMLHWNAHTAFGGDKAARKAEYMNMVNNYYSLATDFYVSDCGNEDSVKAPKCSFTIPASDLLDMHASRTIDPLQEWKYLCSTQHFTSCLPELSVLSLSCSMLPHMRQLRQELKFQFKTPKAVRASLHLKHSLNANYWTFDSRFGWPMQTSGHCGLVKI